MEYLVPARVLIAELEKEELLEARRGDVVGRDLARLVDELGRPPSGFELEEWLEEHRLVTEVYATAEKLDEALHRHLGRAFASTQVIQEARHPDLEKLIREDPEHPEHYLVYSDWLQERSDPLGELIALGVAATEGESADVARFERHLKQHEEHFLGQAAKDILDRVKLVWRFGVVHTILALEKLDTGTLKQVLRLRVCEFLHTIQISMHRTVTPVGTSDDGDEAEGGVLSVIDAHAADSLRGLSLVSGDELKIPETLLRRKLYELSIGSYRATLPDSLPDSLERLCLRVRHVAFHGKRHPRWNIRELDVDFTPQTAQLLAAVALERLERLILHGCRADELPELLRTIEAPALGHLELRGGGINKQALHDIARTSLARRLKSLALTHHWLTDRTMQALAEELSGFEALETLDVSNNELTGEGLQAVRSLAPGLTIVSLRQERPGTASLGRLRRFGGSRFPVAQEIADPKLWKRSGVDGDVLWAQYRGTEDYELFISRDLKRYGCSCPSSYQPCKHVVALALVAEKTELPEKPSGGIQDRVRGRAGYIPDDFNW
jgi:uncharacterized protein (TIGR02996 family)